MNANEATARQLVKDINSYNLKLVFNKVRNTFHITKGNGTSPKDIIMTAELMIRAMNKGYFAINEINDLWLRYRNNYKDVVGKVKEVNPDEVCDEDILGHHYMVEDNRGIKIDVNGCFAMEGNEFYKEQGKDGYEYTRKTKKKIRITEPMSESREPTAALACGWPMQMEEDEPVRIYGNDFNKPLDDRALMANAKAEAAIWMKSTKSYDYSDEAAEVAEWCDEHSEHEILDYYIELERRLEEYQKFYDESRKTLTLLKEKAKHAYKERYPKEARMYKQQRLDLEIKRSEVFSKILQIQRIMPVVNVKCVERSYGGFDTQIALLGKTAAQMIADHGRYWTVDNNMFEIEIHSAKIEEEEAE